MFIDDELAEVIGHIFLGLIETLMDAVTCMEFLKEDKKGNEKE